MGSSDATAAKACNGRATWRSVSGFFSTCRVMLFLSRGLIPTRKGPCMEGRDESLRVHGIRTSGCWRLEMFVENYLFERTPRCRPSGGPHPLTRFCLWLPYWTCSLSLVCTRETDGESDLVLFRGPRNGFTPHCGLEYRVSTGLLLLQR